MIRATDSPLTGGQAASEFDAKKTSPNRRYTWYEMGFCTGWDMANESSRVLCIGTPRDFPSLLKDMLEKSSLEVSDPFAMHALLIDQIVKLHDDAVWAIRDPIREIEKASILNLF